VRSRGGAFAMLDVGDDWVRSSTADAIPAGEAATRDPAGASSSAREKNTDSGPAVPSGLPPSLRARPKGPQVPRMIAQPTPSLSAVKGQGTRPREAPSFGHAWSLLRQGDTKTAAAEFGAVERLAQGRDLEEDALYWRAVATGRSGDVAGARGLFREFLDRFSGSSRAGAAAVSLGWLSFDSGDAHAARRAFERAALDRSPEVRSQAEEGLRQTQEEDR
jgi:TolA-binding protein